jgi:hypothetical protein
LRRARIPDTGSRLIAARVDRIFPSGLSAGARSALDFLEARKDKIARTRRARVRGANMVSARPPVPGIDAPPSRCVLARAPCEGVIDERRSHPLIGAPQCDALVKRAVNLMRATVQLYNPPSSAVTQSNRSARLLVHKNNSLCEIVPKSRVSAIADRGLNVHSVYRRRYARALIRVAERRRRISADEANREGG